MEIINDEIRVAVIFETNKDNLVYESSVLVDYHGDEDFHIISPNSKHTRLDESNYNLLKGSPSFIYGNNEVLKMTIKDADLKYAIYIFPQEYIYKLEYDKSIEEKEAISFIKSKSKSIILDRISVNKFVSHNVNNKSNIESNLLNRIEDNAENINRLVTMNNLPFLVFINSDDSMYKQKNKIIDVDEIDVEQIIEDISKKIIGQERAIKTLVTNIYFNQVLIDSLEDVDDYENELDSRKQAILLDGSTGTGKTAILNEISSKLDIPLVITNANSFSETGYVGPTITDLLEKLLDQADGNIELAQRGIIVLDEIDKIAEPYSASKNMKLGVQQELLGFISGATYELKSSPQGPSRYFDTSKITFILSGAFTNLKERKIRENNKNELGFSNELLNKKNNTYIVDYQDYIKEGLMREFFGRIKIITTTKTYSKDDLKNILLNSEISPLKGFERTCAMLGYKKVVYDDKFIDEICNEAYNMSTGARGLQSLISGIQDTMLADLMLGNYNANLPIELSVENIKKYKKRNRRSY